MNFSNSQHNGRGVSEARGNEETLVMSGAPLLGEGALPFGELFQVLTKRLWIILLTAIVLAGVALGLSLAQTPQYEASMKLLVGKNSGLSEDPNQASGLQQLTQTMTEAISSHSVAETVIQRQGLQATSQELLNNLNVEQIRATQLIQVSYRDPSPQRARQIADDVGNVFSEQIAESGAERSPITATVWDPAETPANPASPNIILNVGVALIAGLLIGVGLAFILEYLDDSWRSPEEAEQVSGVPTFGMIPEFEVGAGKKGRS